jgi:signal transduction histidine kinase/ActR/RegA family two-component response regulator
MKPGRRLFAKYAVLIMGLVSAALLASGALEIFVSSRERHATLLAAQHDKASSAAASVSRYIEDLARQIEWATLAAPGVGAPHLAERRIDYLKLLRLAPAITTVSLVDAGGRERLKVSRVDADRTDSGEDLSQHPGFVGTRDGRLHFGAIHFADQTEPHMSIAVPAAAGDGAVTLAEVNLKFVWTVVTEIKVGERGYAYVVDARGRLVAHPDISLVLQMTELARLPQVRAALAGQDGMDARDLSGQAVLAAHAAIPPLGWFVFVEQPREEALTPLYAAMRRTGLLLLLGLGLALAASLMLVRRMVAPIGALRLGARRIGEGNLGHRIRVETGDELEELAGQFNRMAAQLEDLYADLERRVAERTRELDDANQAKSRFLAAASHDLRQPMHALRLFVEQLRSAKQGADLNALVARIEAAATAMGELLDELLDLSKLDAGVVAAQPQVLRIADLLESIATQFAPLAREKGLKLRIVPSGAWVHSDPALVHRILLNLVSNAVSYTARGGVLVGCRRRGQSLRIAVWDTGCGIPEDRWQDIFREFVQLDHPQRDRGKGLGLGLAIVSRLAELLGSRIELRSTVGRGSMFGIDVPLADAASQVEPPPAQREPQQRAASLRGTFVVIVEDDEPALVGMQRLLEDWGCLTLTAGTAAEALAKLIEHDRPPELIVCDYRLRAGVTGIEAIRQIRTAAQCPVPAVLVTGDTTPEVLRAANERGLPVLHKPVSPAKLRALLAQLLVSASASAQLPLG